MIVWSETESGDITVTVPDQARLLADLGSRFASGQGFSVATLNLDHVVKLKRDPVFRRAYAAHSHITADGNPIVWLSRLAGQEISLIPGSELIEPLVALAARYNVPVAFYGATETALTQAAEVLKARYPGLQIAFCRSPEMGFDPDGDIAAADMADLGTSGARLCFIALGAPKQERLAARAQDLLPGVGFVSIGAGLNFIAGTESRAPAWVRVIAAEWIWRMLSDPKRLARRYGACLLAMPGLTVRALRARGTAKGRQAS